MNPLIVVVGYNRPTSILRLLKSIEEADYDSEDITLMISLDKAENDNGVKSIAESFRWTHGEKIIREFKNRQGLKKHIIKCGDLTDIYEAVIVLEDDLVVSPGYYKYVLQALEFYADEDIIAGISLYSHEWNGYAHRFFQPIVDEFDTYLGQFSITWGQCWTRKSWQGFKTWLRNNRFLKYNNSIPQEINKWGKNSWGRYFVYYITEKQLFYVIPRYSLSTNCSEIGEHAFSANNDHQVRLLLKTIPRYRFAPVEKAIRYDIFFENMQLSRYIDRNYTIDGVDIDLNNTNRRNSHNRYLLSTAQLPFKIVEEYGLQFRPIDMNIIAQVRGNGIYLYDKKNTSKRKDKEECDIVRYEIRGFSKRLIIKCFFVEIKQKLIKILHF